jgi:peptide/nickel transport system permease protein
VELADLDSPVVFVFCARRVFSSAVVLLASTFLVFVLAATTLDPLAKLRQQQGLAPGAINAQAHLLGLDRPAPQRYWSWLTGVLRGNFGVDINNNPINPVLFQRVLVTGRLVLAAMVLATVLAVAVGVLTAVRRNKLSDYISTTISYVLISLPVFWFATLLKQFLVVWGNQHLFGGHHVLWTQGEADVTVQLIGTRSQIIIDRIEHMILPTISLAALNFAAWSRFQRASMLDVLNADYMRMARAKGLRYGRVLVRHGLRNALIPVTTVIALNVGLILGGAVLTERVFLWNGMGTYLTEDAIGAQDVNVLLAWLTVSAVFVITANLIADLLYAVLDPRIRLS